MDSVIHLSRAACGLGFRAIYCSTLAIHVYDVGGEKPHLQSILTGAYDRNILSVSMSPLDPNAIAVTINEALHNICLWDVSAEAVSRRLGAIGPPAFHVQWCVHAAELRKR